ncbi:MAG: Spermidine N(1)-acetyltransferase [Bacteroidetes bacterium ADurb.Bin408]|nr:MAG: Spermidine N(1)-acetyltransferase [Bacteroidetes bacterium ADurb.Bin408]
MLENKNIKLRALEPEDINCLYQWENNTELWHLSSAIKPFSKYELEQYILNSHLDIFECKQLRLVIDVKSGKKMETAGCIDLFDFDPVNLRAGVGLFIADKFRNKGVASEALNILMLYARKKLHLQQLYCSVTTDNKASMKLFESSGFKKTGKRLHWTRKDDKWLDENFYQLIF